MAKVHLRGNYIKENLSNLLIKDYNSFGLTLKDLRLLDEIDKLAHKENKNK